MTEELYMDIRLMVASVLFFTGICLIFGAIPHKLKGSIYDSARKKMGIATITLPIVSIITYFTPLRYAHDDYASVINLTGCYIVLIFIYHTFVPLLGRKIKESSTSFIWNSISCILFPIPMCFMALFGDIRQVHVTIIASAIMFLCLVIYHAIMFFTLYRKAIKITNNYYSDDVEVKIHWILNSVCFIISIGILSSLGVLIEHHTSRWIDLIYTIYRFGVFIYVFASFLKFIMVFETMSEGENQVTMPNMEIVPQIEDEVGKLNPDAREYIHEQINKWVEDNKYTKRGITLQSVATDIYTNRTYLSLYINSTYNCSFKTWVSRLRINEAKRLMYSDMNAPIDSISKTIGFASSASFITVFKQSEGKSPAKWRSEQVTKKDQ